MFLKPYLHDYAYPVTTTAKVVSLKRHHGPQNIVALKIYVKGKKNSNR